MSFTARTAACTVAYRAAGAAGPYQAHLQHMCLVLSSSLLAQQLQQPGPAAVTAAHQQYTSWQRGACSLPGLPGQQAQPRSQPGQGFVNRRVSAREIPQGSAMMSSCCCWLQKQVCRAAAAAAAAMQCWCCYWQGGRCTACAERQRVMAAVPLWTRQSEVFPPEGLPADAAAAVAAPPSAVAPAAACCQDGPNPHMSPLLPSWKAVLAAAATAIAYPAA